MLCVGMGRGVINERKNKVLKKILNIEILQESFILLTTNKLVFTVYIEKYTDVLINSAYIEYEYEYLTHKLYEYEYLKKITRVHEYRVLPPQVWSRTPFDLL